MAYIGYLSAQTVFTKAVIDDLGEVDVVVSEVDIDVIDDTDLSIIEWTVVESPARDVLVTFKGRIFTEGEQASFVDLWIQPYIDYMFYEEENEGLYSQVISVEIQYLGDNEGEDRYTMTVINRNGEAGLRRLISGDKEREFGWFPDCHAPCDYTDEFKELYPRFFQ